MPHQAHVTILGVRVDNVTCEEALTLMTEYVSSGEAHQVVTVNAEFIMAARADAHFAQILRVAHLTLPDGQGLVWAARILGTPLKERVTGVDTLIRMAALAAEKGYRIYLLGAADGVAQAAAGQLRHRFPNLLVVGTYPGSPAPESEQEILNLVWEARPDILFVAYGAPQQEKWIHRNLTRLGVPVAMGVGGAFDFISGRARRAPQWLQRLGLEWLHRLFCEPWRWRRMLALPRFGWLVVRSRLG
jgi:N-acetylglucosaminyldiphosphoundecaprenol N-acetyl-beta-D-mannosaminyltransferase